MRSPGQALPRRQRSPERGASSGRVQHHQPIQLNLFGSLSEPGPPGSSRAWRKPGPGRATGLAESAELAQSPERGRPSARPLSPPPAALPRIVVPAQAAEESQRRALFARLHRLTRGRLRSLALTDNRRTILSVRPCRPGERSGAFAPLVLRIHRSFVTAPEEVLQAVATFVASKKGSAGARHALGVLREHFNGRSPQPAPAPARRLALQPVGSVLDLRAVAGELNKRYFAGRLKVRITWGRAAGETAHNCRRAHAASLQLGSYSYEDRLIRVHRVLDRPEVPRYVIESVIYHELLHADLPPVVRQGRRYFHTPEFRRRERQFRLFEKADRWVRDNLPELLRARRGARSARR